VSTGTLGAADDGRFWILFKDFFQFFFRITVNYTRDDYFITRLADKIVDESWGICRLKLPKDTSLAFISIFQMNMKFFDAEEDAMDVIVEQKEDKEGMNPA